MANSSRFTDPPSPHSPRFARYLDPGNPAHVLYVLDRFKRFRDVLSKHDLPDEFRRFGNTDYAQDEQKKWDNFKALQKMVAQYPGICEVHTFDTYHMYHTAHKLSSLLHEIQSDLLFAWYSILHQSCNELETVDPWTFVFPQAEK